MQSAPRGRVDGWVRAGFLGAAMLLGLAGASGCGDAPAGVDDGTGGPVPDLSVEVRPQAASFAGLQGQALRSALYAAVKGHTQLGYKRARGILLSGLDAHGGVTSCVYTGVTGASFNVEHSWPQSLGAGNEPARSDLHHLFVSESNANSVRGNHLFGETACSVAGTCRWSKGGSSYGPREGRGDAAFEVRPERRGDIARAQFYFAVRYQKSIDDVVETTLRAWHDEDPPDADEVERNDRVEALQHNRNPFVDEPQLVGLLTDF